MSTETGLAGLWEFLGLPFLSPMYNNPEILLTGGIHKLEMACHKETNYNFYFVRQDDMLDRSK